MFNNNYYATRSYDTVVAGGGVAGIAAALASARAGAKTCLLEKEYALGGLATLGLIVIYLPLCDGEGYRMSGGICEELIIASLKYGPGEIPKPWARADATPEERAEVRYRVTYGAPSFMMAAEDLLAKAGVDILYDVRVVGAETNANGIKSLAVAAKKGFVEIKAGAFVDATGDADVCYFAGEETLDDDTNRRTGWYFSCDGNNNIKLNGLTDPLRSAIPETSRTYSGTDVDDIRDHMLDMRRFIAADLAKKRSAGASDIYPLIIPAFHGFRMTRRLAGTFEFSEDLHERVWFDDTIGMIGNWKYPKKRYTIPYRSIKAMKNDNLFAAGRCVSADKSGWDLTRVIPTCAVTGQAAGQAAAMRALSGRTPDADKLRRELEGAGVPFDRGMFTRGESDLA